MKKLDLKGVTLGLVIGMLCSLSLGALSPNPSGPVGRFRLETMQNNAFVIDTTTGQVWRGYFHAGSGGNTDGEFAKPKI